MSIFECEFFSQWWEEKHHICLPGFNVLENPGGESESPTCGCLKCFELDVGTVATFVSPFVVRGKRRDSFLRI